MGGYRKNRPRIVSTFCACRILRAHSVHMFCVYICVSVSMYIVYSISIAAEKLPSNFAAKTKGTGRKREHAFENFLFEILDNFLLSFETFNKIRITKCFFTVHLTIVNGVRIKEN